MSRNVVKRLFVAAVLLAFAPSVVGCSGTSAKPPVTSPPADTGKDKEKSGGGTPKELPRQ